MPPSSICPFRIGGLLSAVKRHSRDLAERSTAASQVILPGRLGDYLLRVVNDKPALGYPLG
ncbi:MAG: hypothetical protein F4X77_08200 [Acidobacteriia bacterium]|nr:hypothetical protein [Terriglobia bacterium]MYC67451.1 hypothetical protein [Terriglobia bacterium]